MARINIEDEFFDDVAAVGARMGDIDRAMGQALRLLRFAQSQIKKGGTVSYQDFSERFSEALMPEFARRVGDTVEVRGAGKHFAWLKERVDAGRKGGRSKTEAKTKTLKQNVTNPSSAEASYSPSYSPSSSGSPSCERGARPGGKPLFETVEALREAIPLVTRDQFAKWYPDKEWRESQYERALSKAMADPGSAPRTAGAWMKYLHSWLEVGWQTRKRCGPIKKQLADMEFK